MNGRVSAAIEAPSGSLETTIGQSLELLALCKADSRIRGQVECPRCHQQADFSKAVNGHVVAVCMSPDCLRIQE